MVVGVLEGNEAIAVVRTMLGATNGVAAAPGTIRGDFSISKQNNLIHGSDSPESAAARDRPLVPARGGRRLRDRRQPLGLRRRLIAGEPGATPDSDHDRRPRKTLFPNPFYVLLLVGEHGVRGHGARLPGQPDRRSGRPEPGGAAPGPARWRWPPGSTAAGRSALGGRVRRDARLGRPGDGDRPLVPAPRPRRADRPRSCRCHGRRPSEGVRAWLTRTSSARSRGSGPRSTGTTASTTSRPRPRSATASTTG